MVKGQKAVARFKDGRLIKGYVQDFTIDSNTVRLYEQTRREEREIPIADLKAIFFVKTFKGYREYVEKKVFGIRKYEGRKVFVKFDDKESLVGFIDGDLPWNKGFTLKKNGVDAKGFFLIPVDKDSNNARIFVVGDAIRDITIMIV